MRACFPYFFLVISLLSSQSNSYDPHGNYDGNNNNNQNANSDGGNLYHDYALKQAMKNDPEALGHTKTAFLWGIGGFALAKLHSSRSTRRLKKKHAAEQKALYTQYYNDVYQMQQTVNEYAYQAEQFRDMAERAEEEKEMERVRRDYEEFKQVRFDF